MFLTIHLICFSFDKYLTLTQTKPKMEKLSLLEKIKERKIGQTLIVYLGSAWVFIEIFNFLVDKYNWDTEVLDIIILIVIFGFPASIIYAWFHQKFTKRAILLQVLNGLIAISLISYNLINPNTINPTQLRILKFKDNQKKLAEAVRSVVILPFANYTGDEGQAYLAAGMHDALITELGQLGAIRVVSKTSALSYLGSSKTIKEIASELNVDAIIEASVLSVDENIRIQLKLINAFPDEQQLWSQTFDSDMSNILNLYNRVIKNIAKEIQLTLSPEQETQLAESREVNPESYKAYLRGMYHIHQLTADGIKKGMEYLQLAVKIDPTDPFAYAGLAIGYSEIAHGPFDPGDSYIKAAKAAFQAIELDTTIAEVYTALGESYIYSFWEFEEGEKYYKRALELNPNSVQTHYSYAWALYLFGRMEEAIFEHELVRDYDPLNSYYTALLGLLYTYAGRHEDAIREAFNSLEIQKDNPFSYWVLGEAYLAMDREDEAMEAYKKASEIANWLSWPLGYAYALTNHHDEAEKILNELEKADATSWNALGCAVIYGALGKNDEAFKWIAYEPHHAWIPWVAVMPMWKPLHDDVRWKEFVEQLNIPK